MKRKELKAEILTLIRKYDDLGLVDYITIDNNIDNELKKFGNNVMEKRSKVLEINGGYAELPVGFFKLDLALKCQPYEVFPEEECDKTWRTDYAVTKRIVNEYEWDNMSDSHYKKSYKEIIEKKEIRGSKIHFKHKPVEVLTLTKGISKDVISDTCVNKMTQKIKGASDMNIIGKRLTTNFREGYVYIEYSSLPTDESEDIVIPDIPYLVDYLKYFCVYKALESIWTNGETTDVADKIAYYKNESNILKASALTASKFEGLGENWHKKVQQKNRQNLRKFYR